MAKGENSPCFQFIKKTLGVGLSGAEIGIWDGGNAEAVLHYIFPKKYYMIDPYREYPGSNTKKPLYDSTYTAMHDKFSLYPNTVIMRITSEEAAKIVEDNLDFVYIDGAHDFDNKMLDLLMWYEKVRPGGVLCGDDFNLPDIQKAVAIFTEKKGLKYDFSSNCDPHPPEFWMIKPKEK